MVIESLQNIQRELYSNNTIDSKDKILKAAEENRVATEQLMIGKTVASKSTLSNMLSPVLSNDANDDENMSGVDSINLNKGVNKRSSSKRGVGSSRAATKTSTGKTTIARKRKNKNDDDDDNEVVEDDIEVLDVDDDEVEHVVTSRNGAKSTSTPSYIPSKPSRKSNRAATKAAVSYLETSDQDEDADDSYGVQEDYMEVEDPDDDDDNFSEEVEVKKKKAQPRKKPAAAPKKGANTSKPDSKGIILLEKSRSSSKPISSSKGILSLVDNDDINPTPLQQNQSSSTAAATNSKKRQLPLSFSQKPAIKGKPSKQSVVDEWGD